MYLYHSKKKNYFIHKGCRWFKMFVFAILIGAAVRYVLCQANRGLHVPVGFILLRYSVLLLLSPYLCCISFLYLELYVLGDDALIS